MPCALVEEAIAEHYRTLQLPTDFAAEARSLLEQAVVDEKTTIRELHANLNRQLKDLDKRESGLIDLLADGAMPKEKVRMKLIEIKSQRTRLEAGLANTSEELSLGASVLSQALDLIADPYTLYRDASPGARRLLNETFYQRFYVDDLEDGPTPQVSDEKTMIFADLHATARVCHDSRTRRSKPIRDADHKLAVGDSNKHLMVVPAGFEPATSRV